MNGKIIKSSFTKSLLLFTLFSIGYVTNLWAQTGNQTVATLTRYEIEQKKDLKFHKILKAYVKNSLKKTSNIMCEAYYEQDVPHVFWLIERWDRSASRNYGKSKHAVLALFAKKLSARPAKIYRVKDLEPLTKQEWRSTSGKEDNQLVIMLFVSAKPGTQQSFKAIYHEAMPKFRSEPGVVTYQLSEIEGEDTQFVTYEKFRDEEAFNFHLNFPPIKPVIEYLETSIQNPPFQNGIHRLTELAPLTRK